MTDSTPNLPKQNSLPAAIAQAIKQVKVESSSFAGPLPPPDVLAKYDQISPGFADRIIKMAELEVAHRHAQEQKSLAADIAAREMGMRVDAQTISQGFEIQKS